MNPSEEIKRRLGECPLIAIIRGVTPGEAEAIGAAIYEAGIRIIDLTSMLSGPWATMILGDQGADVGPGVAEGVHLAVLGRLERQLRRAAVARHRSRRPRRASVEGSRLPARACDPGVRLRRLALGA